MPSRVGSLVLLVIMVHGCRRNAPARGDEDPHEAWDKARRNRIQAALADVEGSTGQAKIDAQSKHLKNELSHAQAAQVKGLAGPTGAEDVSAGRYGIPRDGQTFIRREIVLVQGNRAVVISGESASKSASAFDGVFDNMWPTIRISEPDSITPQRLIEGLKNPTHFQAL